MSKFYLPTSTPASTTTPSPLTSPPSPRTNPLASFPPEGTSSYKKQTYALDAYSSDEEDTLPYPQPLPRSDFLDPDFHAQTYLSTLGRDRHQTLEDLRGDLRARSQLLSRELLDLVNGNYEEFLSLGSTLKGGDERVENVRVGVLGFQRVVEGVRDEVEGREREVRGLVDERRMVKRDLLVGRKLLDIDERLGELEGRLMIEPALGSKGDVATKSNETEDAEEDEYDDDDDDDDEEDEVDSDEELTPEARAGNAVVSRLRKHAQLYLLLQRITSQVGHHHPFITAQAARITRIRNTLLLDLRAALRQARKEGESAGGRVLRVAALYRALGEGEELVAALKGA